MAENKTQRTKASVAAFLAKITDPERRKAAKGVDAAMRKATGAKGAMWGPAIIGYGDTTYTGSGGRVVDWFHVGFSPRKAGLALYLMGGLKKNPKLLAKLGPHKIGGGCLYLKTLDGVDTKVLTELIKGSVKVNIKTAKEKQK
jgi:hypothetical protein